VTAGGARHNYITVEGIALATAVDSLLAVKHLVYEEQRVAMDDLLAATRANFEGYEELRQTFLNRAPKFGTDNLEADALARECRSSGRKRRFVASHRPPGEDIEAATSPGTTGSATRR
jgi:formate C-acetyltransferase